MRRRSRKLYRSIYGKDPAGPAWEAEKALIGGYSLTRMMAVAPKTPPPLVAELRQAFQAMGKDQAFSPNGTKAKARRRAWCPVKKPEVSPRRSSKRQRKP